MPTMSYLQLSHTLVLPADRRSWPSPLLINPSHIDVQVPSGIRQCYSDDEQGRVQATTQTLLSTFTAAAPGPLQSLPSDLFSDSRVHGYPGPTRNVRFPRATTSGDGTVGIASTYPGTSGVAITTTKILTRARNGDLIMWDLDKPGSTSAVGFAGHVAFSDEDLPPDFRSVPHLLTLSLSHPLQAVVSRLDNGSIYRWDLQMGQRGPILALDWCSTSVTSKGVDNVPTQMERSWIVSRGLDHTVKMHRFHLTATMPVRRLLWRPDYPCELAPVSNGEFSGGSGAELLASPRMRLATPSILSPAVPASESKDLDSKSGLAGDTVEIWDHASGTFVQIDLRHSHQPIDAVPRVALSWNAVDSSEGGLAHPDRRSLVADWRSRSKALSDKSHVPYLQNMGMYVHVPPSANAGPDVFVRLGKGYVVPDKSTKEICALNAEVAIQAGNIHAAQAWNLLGSLLMDVVPESIIASLPPPGKADPPRPLIHSASARGALPSTEGAGVHNTSPVPNSPSYRATSAGSVTRPVASPRTPSRSRIGHHPHHSQGSRSASVNALPPTMMMTPAGVAQKRPLILVSTGSLVPSHARRPSGYSRGMASAQSESPSVASVSDRSLRHAGEGALEDSDSSDGPASGSVVDSHANEMDLDELAPLLPKSGSSKVRSMSAGGRRRTGPAACSNDEIVVRVAQELDCACEALEEPEPEFDGGVARCAGGPPTDSPRPLSSVIRRTGSQSSVGKVIAASVHEQGDEVAVMDSGKHLGGDRACELGGDKSSAKGGSCGSRRTATGSEMACPERGAGRVCGRGWSFALVRLEPVVLKRRDPSGRRPDVCDACAGGSRGAGAGAWTIQFVEAYVDMLTRYRLHACAAYLRKYSRVEEEPDHLHRLPKVPEARSRSPFEKPARESDALVIFPSGRCFLGVRSVRTVVIKIVIGVITSDGGAYDAVNSPGKTAVEGAGGRGRGGGRAGESRRERGYVAPKRGRQWLGCISFWILDAVGQDYM
ncbi:hypothetical protein HD554DRAFT_2040773 [Boletus coccyginus]|nr:hypothetical protein HD554DRAFT_2040773 [Boletus coccyginus]